MSVETVTLIAATIGTLVGVGTFFHFFLMVMRWPQATGKVVGNTSELRSLDTGTDYVFFAQIQFQASDGKTYQVKGDIGLNDEWPLGKAVSLRYRRYNPNHATTMKNWQRLLFSVVFLGFAAACWYAWSDMR
ncbi:MAG: DUF3592 domain-containing protein [Pseudomonadota bacterium]